MEDILAQLNPAQREAVTNYEGPSLIVAGAGSGKTRVLTSRIAYMIADGVAPHTILALTFTNKAAAEMRERIEGMVGQRSRYIRMGTFHSVFMRILRDESRAIEYPAAFTVYDTTDSVSLVRSIIRDMMLGDNEKYKPRNVFAKISRLKNDLITPEVYESDSAFTADDRKRGTPQFLEIYRRYTQQCRAGGAMDFDDLLLNMVVLLKNNPGVLEKYRELFRYILVDEYQDTNHVQYLIVKALAMAHGNVCVVGDDSQSIYSFRGARIENILGFRRDFPGARVYKLEQNYRSTQVIVNAANAVIARNASSHELKKECFSAGAQGERIKLLKSYTDREEAEVVASEIRALGRGGTPWADIAVLYRVNALSRGIEEALRKRDIPYKIYRGHSFFDRKEIKDLLCYLRLIVNPLDDEAFKRVVNYPARGIGEVTLGRLWAARRTGMSLWDAACESDDRKIRSFVDLVHTLSLLRSQLSLYEFGREVATRTGILGVYKADGSAESISALENIEELLNSMAAEGRSLADLHEDETSAAEGRSLADLHVDETSAAGSADGAAEGRSLADLHVDETSAGGSADGGEDTLTLEDWLSNVALMTDMDNDDPENRDKVTLMTVHSAKGLEFSHVFIVGLEEELFPSVRDGDAGEIEEERRLFYVALTRARERSFLSLAQMRFIHGSMTFRRPSRFVREIDARFLEGTLSETPPTPPAGPKPLWEPRKPAGPREATTITPDARFRKLASTPRGGAVERESPSHGGVAARKGDGEAGSTDLPRGARVSHTKFGPGTVNDTEPMAGGGPGDLKITVTFDNPAHGQKTLLSKFAKLEII